MYLCIDIGTNSIRVLEKSSDGQVLKWGKLERPSKPFHTSISPLDENDAAKHLKILISKMGVLPREITASIPAFLTFTAVSKSLNPAAIPAAPGTFKLDSTRLLPDKFFLTAVPNDVIEKYGRIFGELGFESARWEPRSAILAKNFGASPEPTLIIDADDRFTALILAENGKPVFVEQTDFTFVPDERDVIISKVKKIFGEKKIKNLQWITKHHFLNF